MTSRELAARLGHSQDWLYRNLARLEAVGLPKPLIPWGYYKWDRHEIEAFLSGYARLTASPANDAAAGA